MNNTKDLTLIAILSIIVFLQEQILSFIPNVQLTFFFLILFSKKLKFNKTSIIIFIYVLLDSLVNGFSLFTPFILVGLLLIPLLLNTIFSKFNSSFSLALVSILFSLLYSWINIIPGCIMFNIDFMAYLIGDIKWEIILIINSFISTLLLYDLCSKVFKNYGGIN